MTNAVWNMKKISVVLAAMLMSVGIGAQTPARELVKRLQKLQKKGIMLGHQDSPVYGTTWKWDNGRSDVLETVGDYPAVMGFDLGKIELGSDENLDGVPFERMRREIIAHYLRGGIVTLSWHPWNPVTGENAWDSSGEAVKDVLYGGSQYRKFEGWLETVAAFINSLQTPDGQRIPVIFRPWHEMNGGWFWWGAKSCTAEEYINLFTFTHHKLVDQYRCNNIVWAWSPNLSDVKTEAAFMERYPGNQYVDLIGVDIYEFDNNDAAYSKNLKETLDVLVSVASKEHKLAALTEIGCRGIGKKTDWFMNTLWPVLRQYKLSYVLFWRNDWQKPEEESYLPATGDEAAPDFKKWVDLKEVCTVKDIRKVK